MVCLVSYLAPCIPYIYRGQHRGVFYVQLRELIHKKMNTAHFQRSVIAGIWNFDFSAFFCLLPLSRDKPVVSGGGKRSTRLKPHQVAGKLLTRPGQDMELGTHGERKLSSQQQRLRPHGHQGRPCCSWNAANGGTS